MQNVLAPGEFVQAIEVPLERPRASVRAYKISKRFDCDISAVCAGLAIERDATDRIVAARLAFGGMAATVRRASARRGRARRRSRWNEAALSSGAARARGRLHAAQRHARERRLPACRSRRTCCAASGSRRAPRSRSPPTKRASGQLLRGPQRTPCSGQRHESRARSALVAHVRCRCAAAASGARVGVALPHESAHLHVAGAAPYVDDLPELAGTLHAALGLSPVAHGRLLGVRPRSHRRVARRRRRARRRRHPRAERLWPGDPRRPDPRRRHGPLPRPAGVRGDRRDARRGAARGRAGARGADARAARADPDAGRGARGEELRPGADAPRARRRARRDRRRAAPPRRHARGRRPGAVLSRRPDLVRGAARGPRHARPLLDAAPERDAAPRRQVPRPVSRTTCRSNAGAWAAASAARSRSRRCSRVSPRSRPTSSGGR